MTHPRTVIRDAAAAALGAISGLAIYTNRTRPLDTLPAAEVRTPTETIARADKNGASDRRLELQITIYTAGAGGPEQAEDWADSVRAALYGDSALAALILDMILASTRFMDHEEGEEVYWIQTLIYAIRYTAPESNPGG